MKFRNLWRSAAASLAALAFIAPVVPAQAQSDSGCSLTITSAKEKVHGAYTNVWGSARGCNGTLEIQRRIQGNWVTEATAQINGNADYVMNATPMTSSPGNHVLRAKVGNTTTSETVVKRLGAPSITTTGSRPVGVETNAWGTFPGMPNHEVWTEVLVNGSWSRSQVRKTDRNGYYAIPLTYGANSPGTYRYRVAGKHADGSIVRTQEVNFTRTAKPNSNNNNEKLDPRCMKGRVLCASKTTNKMHWMIDGKIIETVDVRYGRKGLETKDGQHKVEWKSRNHVSSIYGSRMPFSMFFYGGQAVHYSDEFARIGYRGVGSHGCINVRDWKALERIYNQVKVGDKVVVYW